MKKLIIATIVGAIISFAWQSSSHMFMGIHDKAYLRTEAQDTAIAAFAEYFKEEGQYLVPRAPDGVSHEEAEAYMKSRAGKPWALVTYHKTTETDMVMPIIRCFLVHIFCVLLVVLVIRKQAVGSRE